MAENKLQFNCQIEKAPSEVIDFVADVNNRTKYQSALTAVSEIQGPPGNGQTWQWHWEMLDMQFQGTGKGVQYEEGKLYEFVTEGDVSSRFTYRAEAAGEGTGLTVEVQFDLPAELKEHANLQQFIAVAQEKGEQSLGQLKQTIER